MAYLASFDFYFYALKTNGVTLAFDINKIFHESILKAPEEQKEQDIQEY